MWTKFCGENYARLDTDLAATYLVENVRVGIHVIKKIENRGFIFSFDIIISLGRCYAYCDLSRRLSFSCVYAHNMYSIWMGIYHYHYSDLFCFVFTYNTDVLYFISPYYVHI